MWFVNTYLDSMGKGDFKDENAEIIFNRDRLINETDVINNCKSSLDIISDETVVSMHPWVTDIKDELDKLKRQREEENPVNGNEDYEGDFKHHGAERAEAGGENAKE